MFTKYPSITNKRPTKDDHDETAGVVWVATPKYHGTNMSVVVTRGEAVRFGRRNGFLTPEESHYGHEKLLPKLADWNRLLDAFPDADSVTVFGELYGS
jgi:hypothetical protein